VAQPDYDQYLAEIWGWPNEGLSGQFTGASNIVIGSNPPYSVADFIVLFPQFGGTPVNITGTLVSGDPTVSSVSSTAGLAVGQLIIGAGIVGGSTIAAIDAGAGTITLSAPASATGSGVALTVYLALLVPLVILNTYITLASASLVQARWLDSWTIGMGWFVAHYLTLLLQAQTGDGSARAVASAGLAIGIKTSKEVGDVSVGISLIDGLKDWGAWQLTIYGQQLATIAAVIGMGPMVIY
jgi:hypothetical protein